MIKNIMYNYNHFQLSILKRYGFCHFIPALRELDCFDNAKEFLNECKDFLFLNLLLMVEKNLSFQEDMKNLYEFLKEKFK